jgi:hypothetical protein
VILAVADHPHVYSTELKELGRWALLALQEGLAVAAQLQDCIETLLIPLLVEVVLVALKDCLLPPVLADCTIGIVVIGDVSLPKLLSKFCHHFFEPLGNILQLLCKLE